MELNYKHLPAILCSHLIGFELTSHVQHDSAAAGNCD
jgi:hypothetical protein